MIDTNNIEAHAARVSNAFLALHSATEAVFAAEDQAKEARLACHAESTAEEAKAKQADLAACVQAERKARHLKDLAHIEMEAAKAHTGLLDMLVRCGAVALATPPVSVQTWREEDDARDTAIGESITPAALEFPTEEQKLDSGTPKRARRTKAEMEAARAAEAAQLPDAPNDERQRSVIHAVTESSSEVAPDGTWANDLDRTIGEVRPAPPAPPEALTPEASEAIDLIVAEIQGPPEPIEEPAPAASMGVYLDASERADIEALFTQAGMDHGKTYDFIRSIWPDQPGTINMLKEGHARALRPLLAGRIRELPPVVEPAPAEDLDPLVSEELATEVRAKARELLILPADAVVAIRKRYGVEGVMQLRVSQARELVDGGLQEVADEIAAYPVPW